MGRRRRRPLSPCVSSRTRRRAECVSLRSRLSKALLQRLRSRFTMRQEGSCKPFFHLGMRLPARHFSIWDGRSAAGPPVTAGIYFLKLDGNPEARARLTVIH